LAFDFDKFLSNCDRFGAAIRSLGGRSSTIEVGPPATNKQLCDVEATLGRPLPPNVRHILGSYASHFRFEWKRDHFASLPHPWKHAQDGRCLWSLQALPALNADLEKWRLGNYGDPSNAYDRHWHHAFAVCATGLSDGTSSSTDWSGGDFFALRDLPPAAHSVIFLSHDGDTENNGRILAPAFDDFLMRWSAIGCVGGATGWAFEYFISDAVGGIEPEGAIAVRFRELLSVQLD
jgi:hypothetical protein